MNSSCERKLAAAVCTVFAFGETTGGLHDVCVLWLACMGKCLCSSLTVFFLEYITLANNYEPCRRFPVFTMNSDINHCTRSAIEPVVDQTQHPRYGLLQDFTI